MDGAFRHRRGVGICLRVSKEGCGEMGGSIKQRSYQFWARWVQMGQEPTAKSAPG